MSIGELLILSAVWNLCGAVEAQREHARFYMILMCEVLSAIFGFVAILNIVSEVLSR